MAERATIFDTVQLGVETIKGSAPAGGANKKLLATGIETAIKADVKTFRAQGTKFPALAALGKEWVEAKISGQAAYNDLAYLLASLMMTPTPAKQGTTTAYKSTFTVDNDTPDAVTTFYIQQGSSVRAHSFNYGLVTELGLDFSRDSIDVSGAMLGKDFTDAAALTAAPTEIAVQPILPTEVSVYLADTAAGLAGAEALERALKASWKLGGRFGPLWTLNAAESSWAAEVEKEPDMQMTLLVEADDEGMGLLSQMRTGASKFMRIKAEGPTIAETYKWTLQIDMCGKVQPPSDFSDQDGVFAIEWTLKGAYDPTWGKAVQVELINTISAL